MTDEDTLYKYIQIIKHLTGREYELHSYDRSHENRQRIYQVNICGENARVVMRTIVPHMSYRRKQRIWQSLNGHRSKKLTLDKILDLPKPNILPGQVTYMRRK